MGCGTSAAWRPGLKPQFLLDTHVVIRWRANPKKLSREQTRVLREAVRHRQPVAISAITLLEIAVLLGGRHTRSDIHAHDLLNDLASNPAFEILPLTVDVASEVVALGESLRDPADRTIVGTARVHKLRLLTSDQRIIDSKLVPTVA